MFDEDKGGLNKKPSLNSQLARGDTPPQEIETETNEITENPGEIVIDSTDKGSAQPTPQTSKTHQSNLVLKIVIIVLGVLILGTGAFAGVYFTTKKSYTDVVKNSFEAMKNLQSWSHSLTAQAKISQSSDIMAVLQGDNEKLNLGLDIKAHIIKKTKDVDFSAEVNLWNIDKEDETISTEFKKIDKSIFVKIPNLQNIPYIGMFLTGVMDFDLEGKWFIIDTKDKEELGNNPIDGIINKANESFVKFEEETDKNEDIIMEAQQMFFEFDVFDVLEVEKDKTDAGVKIYKYKFSLNKENALSYVRAVNELFDEDKKVEEVKFLKIMDALQSLEISLEIDRKTYYIYQAEIILSASDEGKFNLQLQLGNEMSNFNMVQAIPIPENKITFKEIMTMIERKKMNEKLETLSTMENLLKDSDEDGLTDYDEKYIYFSDINNEDSDGDSFLDGEEVKNGFDPMGEDKLEKEYNYTLYFPGRSDDVGNCKNVTPVERLVINPVNAVKMIIEELIKGPNLFEKDKYVTSIDSSITVDEIDVKGNTIIVDFDENLSETTAGSCDVEATRSQIERTLESMTGIYSSIIMVDGEWDGVLEP